MSTISSTRGWHTVSQHKITSFLVFVVAAVALTVTLILTNASHPAGGRTNNSRPATPSTYQQAPCDIRPVGSYC